jgi:deoxyadenosine/deoxycytidine kinase
VIPVVVVTGPVGVGKTAVTWEMAAGPVLDVALEVLERVGWIQGEPFGSP